MTRLVDVVRQDGRGGGLLRSAPKRKNGCDVPLFLASADSSSWRRVDNADGIGGCISYFLIYDLETSDGPS